MSKPFDLQSLSVAAFRAERERNWDEAAVLYEAIRTGASGHEAAWLGSARALREQRRYDELDSILTEARDRFPGSFAIATEYSAASVHRRDAEEAIRRARAVREAFPDQAAAHSDLCAALNLFRRFEDADRLTTRLIGQFPSSLPIHIEHARAAEGIRDWSQVYDRWQLVDNRFPERVISRVGMALALREQRRFDEADALLAKAIDAFPGNRQLLEAAALVAQVRRDWLAAAARWEAVLDQAPDNAAALLGRALAFREAKQFVDAEKSLLSALERLPSSVPLLSERARLATAQGDQDRAIKLWQMVREQSPASPRSLVEIASIMLQQKRFNDAEALLEPELGRFAHSSEVGIAYAQIPSRQRAWPEAAQRWRAVEALDPDDIHVLGGLAEALWGLKDERALVAVLDRLLTIQPSNVTGAILYARLEMRRNKAADAVLRLSKTLELWPNNQQLKMTLADARMQALVTDDVPPTVARTDGAKRQEKAGVPETLFEQFESLGSGCEFGLLQRSFGAEPLGLLRWGTISPQGLIDMLEERFQGIGDQAHTSIRPVGGNYELHDTRYKMSMQTFIATSTEAADTLLPKLCNRLRYLARCLMENMEDADRILLYKGAEKMKDLDIQRLWRAVKSYGDNALLLVRLADDEHPSASLDVVDEGLMMGAIDRYSNTDISVGAWTSVCQAAVETWAHARKRRHVMSTRDPWS